MPLLSVMRGTHAQAEVPGTKQEIEKNEVIGKKRGIEMTTRTAETSPLLRARVAGVLYLSLVPLGLVGVLSSGPSRFGIVSALLLQIVNIFVVLLLYQILKPVNKTMAVLMVIFLLLGVPIAMLNELNQFAVLLLSSGADSLRGFTAEQLHALVLLFGILHTYGINIAGLFWGLWLFPMGYLVFKSGFLPRFLGILLMIGCLGYLIQSGVAFLLPNLEVNIALFTFWGEVLFLLWLLMKGVNVERWEKRAREAA
jgi:hypothetical protein